MIWTPPWQEFPEDGHIHPAYDGKDGDIERLYKPAWHILKGVNGE